MSDLLLNVLNAHGGLDTWNSFHRIHARLSFGGLAFDMRWNRKGLTERFVHISTQTPKVIFDDFPKKNQQGIFTADEVRIESYGKVVSARKTSEITSVSFRRSLWWTNLELLYFAGYACWNYLTTPFLLANNQIQVIEIEPASYLGKNYRRLKATFSENIPTHSESQTFWLDDEYKLIRHDYDPKFFATWATAAHICEEHKRFLGMLFPTKRYVIPRMPNDETRPNPILVWINIKEITLD